MGAASSTQPKLRPQLLDTQLLLWLAIAPERLEATLRGNLRDRRFPMLYSVVSLWEVAIKTSLGKPGFVVDAAHLRDGLKQQGLQELGIEPEHSLAVQHLPWIHRDPFDRLLVAQAIHNGLTLLTADRTLRGYGHQVIWMGDGGSGG
ncbi:MULTISPECIES: type II toxin-antitoxin system VapC family toxin [unclassified Cyanobium]|uniref:type II toxin-antitoxin system VapC family toxin n=1 Tax=unclassified Cyanobium TaxID=2627006 RepID=UPI0020CD88D8|nr:MULTISPECIES: type II toxin-antitoxin system VapC family toxin [unclassified Cyanobium]MCP9779042.1 type II toxin-antitoxin system VapC family toxin [Cyanobium sp. Tous-M-B4]MCP9877536.1 type II toxin-antitoxin system VapC family toxin [Cyanobium sp. A2C-AMD]